MVQQIARAHPAPPQWAEASSTGMPQELGGEWLILRDCRLIPSDRNSSPTVLIHPARGVAVLDIPPSRTPEAAEAVLARLGAARFPAIFAGHLPVVHLRVGPRQMPFLPSLLDDAFAAEAPLRLPGGDAWVGVAARALTAEQRSPRVEPQLLRDGGMGRRLWRGTVAGLRRAVVALLCLAALGGVVAIALKYVPTPDPARDTAPATVATPAPPARPIEEGPREAARPVPPPPPLPASPPVVAPVPAPPPSPPPVAAPATAPPPSAPPPQPAAAPAPAPPSPPPSVAAPAPAPVPPLPDEAIAAAPAPERPLTALPEVPVAIPPAPPEPPSRAAAPPRRAPEANAPPARRAQERTPPRRQQEAGASAPAEPSPPPEAAAERCRRVSALVGSGAPLGDADMRFFNESCIRW